MIKINNLEKSFGSKVLFKNASFNINPREKIGLVGRNGHGKTTFVRILIGEEHQDNGNIDIPRRYRIGHVSQQIKFTEENILKETSLGLQMHEKEHVWKAEKILSGLGFSCEDMQKQPDLFSGGFQVRLNLAKVLVSEPDLLLLDEPTNYLDITSIRWLISFLKNWSGELLLITHDRSFMDQVITHSIIIHRGNVKKLIGNTEKLYEQIAKEEEIYENTRLNDEKKRKDMQIFISRFRAKARLAGMVQSRIKTMQKMEKRGKLIEVKDLEFSFREAPFPAKNIVTVKELEFGYQQDFKLVKDLSCTIGKSDRICIIGKNGKGKTTLLRLLAKELSGKGEVIYHPKMEMSFFAQTNKSTLEDKRSVFEEIASADTNADNQAARNICGAMLFEGDDALKKIAVLSGGEKSRVMLGKILMRPSNILLLDEPTNHFDMQSCDSLIEALDSFNGAVVMVTHNEMFLNALANRLIVFQGNKVSLFEGSYNEFLEKVGWEDEDVINKQENIPGKININKKELRKIRSDIISRRSKILKPLEKNINLLENEIEKKEAELAEIQNSLIKASTTGQSNLITELSKKSHQYENEIHLKYEELSEVSEKHENFLKEFDNELAELEI